MNTPQTEIPIPQGYSRRHKAAMIVQMLVGNGDKLSLAAMPEQIQTMLAYELGTIRRVDKATVAAVADEFVRELSAVGLSAPGGTENALRTLAGHLSPELANRLQSELASATNGDPWTLITGMPAEDILPIMQTQSTEVCAVVLSKLPVKKAAEVLGKLPGERARRITFAVSQTASIAPQTVKRIGSALVKDHCGRPRIAFEKAPVQRLGDILNATTATTRDTLLEGLNGDDATFASDVRKAIFTFTDIPARVRPADVPGCIRGVESDILVRAIAATMQADAPLAEAANYILDNISQRMATQIREEAEEAGKIKKSDAEDAMNAVTAAIRQLVDDGTIKLIETDADPDD